MSQITEVNNDNNNFEVNIKYDNNIDSLVIDFKINEYSGEFTVLYETVRPRQDDPFGILFGYQLNDHDNGDTLPKDIVQTLLNIARSVKVFKFVSNLNQK